MSIYEAPWYRHRHQDVTAHGTVLAADVGPVALVAAASKKTVFVQEIIVNVTTDAAFTVTFRDDAGTPLVIAEIPARPGKGPQRFWFGEEGRPLTADKGLNLVLSGAGLAFTYDVYMYRKLTANASAILPANI